MHNPLQNGKIISRFPVILRISDTNVKYMAHLKCLKPIIITKISKVRIAQRKRLSTYFDSHAIFLFSLLPSLPFPLMKNPATPTECSLCVHLLLQYAIFKIFWELEIDLDINALNCELQTRDLKQLMKSRVLPLGQISRGFTIRKNPPLS